jgi:hypothetical protein
MSFYNPGHRFVVAVDKDKADRPEGATLLRSYVVPNDPFESVKILEAARATSAAPTFFKAQPIFSPRIGVKNFV